MDQVLPISSRSPDRWRGLMNREKLEEQYNCINKKKENEKEK